MMNKKGFLENLKKDVSLEKSKADIFRNALGGCYWLKILSRCFIRKK